MFALIKRLGPGRRGEDGPTQGAPAWWRTAASRSPFRTSPECSTEPASGQRTEQLPVVSPSTPSPGLLVPS